MTDLPPPGSEGATSRRLPRRPRRPRRRHGPHQQDHDPSPSRVVGSRGRSWASSPSSSLGQYLNGFEAADGRGEVFGSVELADGSSASVVIVTSGPAFPTGDDPAAEVCILSTRLH